MNCPKCNGGNVQVRAVSEDKKKGCLTVFLCIVLFFIPIAGWVAIFMLLRGGRTKTVFYNVCQNCGNHWKIFSPGKSTHAGHPYRQPAAAARTDKKPDSVSHPDKRPVDDAAYAEKLSANYFKKRAAAFAIAILVVALSTVYGIHRSLGSACQELTDSFYVGVYNASWGTTRPGIDAQLTKRYQSANAMVTLLSSYDELSAEAEALRSAKNNLSDAASIHSKYRANEELDAVFGACVSKLDDMSLGERELRMKEQYVSDFAGAQGIIENSGYNEAVREFYRSTLNVFPTNIVRGLVSDKLPELFE